MGAQVRGLKRFGSRLKFTSCMLHFCEGVTTEFLQYLAPVPIVVFSASLAVYVAWCVCDVKGGSVGFMTLPL